MHNEKITVRDLWKLLGSLLLIFLVVAISVKVRQAMPAGIVRKLVLFSPLLPFILMIGAVVRYFGRVDEYLRQVILENWAMTSAITMGWTFIYGFLESAGFSRLSMTTICPVMGCRFRRSLYRPSSGRPIGT